MRNSEAQLLFIENMISTAKGNIGESSIFYLWWGYLAIAAALIQFFLLQYIDFQYSWISWPILMSIGGIVTLVIDRKKKIISKVKSHVESFMSYLWLGVVVTLILVLLMISKIQPSGAYPIIILLYGLGTFVSGGVLKFTALKIGGIACWLIGFAAIFFDFPTQVLLIALALLISYIIPGHLLAAKGKRNV